MGVFQGLKTQFVSEGYFNKGLLTLRNFNCDNKSHDSEVLCFMMIQSMITHF